MNSNHFNGKIFLNPVPTQVMTKGAMADSLWQMFQKHPGRNPQTPLGPFPFISLPGVSGKKEDVYITWLGHSGILLQIEGLNILIDTLWCQRASPVSWAGPKRYFDNPIPLNQLPPIDLVILSHDHYDHLDKKAVLQLAARKVPILTMCKVGALLSNWGVSKKQVQELDWWEEYTALKGLKITAAPARHFSGRGLGDRFKRLWGSFIIQSNKHRIYFGADSGYYSGFEKIGTEYGPFDLTLLEIGAYNNAWREIHMGPEGAVQAHLDLRGKLLMPIHWGMFSLAFHPWKEPVEKLIEMAAQRHISLALPKPGEMFALGRGAFNSRWWEVYR